MAEATDVAVTDNHIHATDMESVNETSHKIKMNRMEQTNDGQRNAKHYTVSTKHTNPEKTTLS